MNTDRQGMTALARTTAWVGLCAVLAACGGAPPCHYAGTPTEAPSAGCIVVYQGRLLVAEGRGGKYSVPGGSVNGGEAAQCGAERETWEETGVDVAAGELAVRFDNGFHLFWCAPILDSPVIDIHRPLEIASADFIAPADFDSLNWRFPEQAALLARMLHNRSPAD